MDILTPTDWDSFLSSFPEHHFLQSTAWGALKAAFGWQPVPIVCGDFGAQVLFRRLPLGLTIGYLGKGPVYDLASPYPPDWQNLWTEIDRLCRRRRAVFLSVEPDLWLSAVPLPDNANQHAARGTPTEPNASHPPPGFQPSPASIQPLRTLVVDLGISEEQILARMKQKTRYNIRLAQRRGVTVRPTEDTALFHRLLTVTGERDAFGVHSADYYQRIHQLFNLRGQAQILLAELGGEPLAALFTLVQGKRAYYLYGASTNAHRDAMPTYLIQWEAMRWARSQGCIEYDLWGVPDADVETLEAKFNQRSDGLWGVYRFKRGFGGELRRAAGPWDRVYNPILYKFYQWWSARHRGET